MGLLALIGSSQALADKTCRAYLDAETSDLPYAMPDAKVNYTSLDGSFTGPVAAMWQPTQTFVVKRFLSPPPVTFPCGSSKTKVTFLPFQANALMPVLSHIRPSRAEFPVDLELASC
jgi:hypothetical protein